MTTSYLELGQTQSTIRRAVDRRGLATFASTTLACALVASALLFHAWVRTRVTEEGYRLSRLSAEHHELVREHERLQLRAAELKSPQRIEELARSRLGMGPPQVDRVVVLSGGAVRPSALVASSR
jgi:cell division protein FtsL